MRICSSQPFAQRCAWGILYFVLGGTIAAGIFVGSYFPAGANHPYYDSSNCLVRQWHLYTIHDTSLDENACVDSYVGDSTVTDSYARTRVANTLLYDNPSGDWHRLLGNSWIYLILGSAPCSSASADLANRELRYRVYTDSSAEDKCLAYGQGSYSNCSDPEKPVTDCVGGCHPDYYYYNIVHSRTVIYDGDGTYDHRRRIVNHETGHALGLGDPKNVDGDPAREPCTNNSIMHLGMYCPRNTNFTWPTTADGESVNFNVHRP